MSKRKRIISAKKLKEKLEVVDVFPAGWVGDFLETIENGEYRLYDGLVPIEGGYITFAEKNGSYLAIAIKFVIGKSWQEIPPTIYEGKTEFTYLLRTIAEAENCIPIILNVLCDVESGSYLDDFVNVVDVRIELA